jgi:hypothetical protein
MTSGTIIARQRAKPGTEEMFPLKVTHIHSPRLFGLDFLCALAIGISALLYHYYESRCPHLRETRGSG